VQKQENKLVILIREAEIHSKNINFNDIVELYFESFRIAKSISNHFSSKEGLEYLF